MRERRIAVFTMRARVVILALLLVGAVLPLPAQADMQARIDAAVTDVREETWMDQPPSDAGAGDGLPKTPVLPGTTYRNPYFNASRSHSGSLGHYLAATIILPDVSSDPASTETAGYIVTAEIKITSEESLEAKLTKESANTFLAEFDLDGGVAEDRDALPPGVFDMVVEVYRVSSDPLHGAERVGVSTFQVKNDPGRPLSAFRSVFPTDYLRKWKGLGGLEHIPMTGQVPTEQERDLSFNFPASSDSEAEVTAFLATRRSPTGPGDSGDVTVSRTVLTAGNTTSAGTIRSELVPADVLGSKQGDLIVVASYLTGDSLNVGASLMVLPASDASAQVSGYTATEFAGPTANQTDGFEVTVFDESGQANAAESVAVWSSGTVIAPARFVRSELGDGDRFFANYAYADIRQEAPQHYQIYTLLYRSTAADSSEFHALATSQRGLSATIPFDVQVPRQERGQIPLRVASMYTDGDRDQEVGFLMDATLEVTGLPDQGTYTKHLTLNESETREVEIPFSASPSGSYFLQVNVTAAEVTKTQTLTVTVPGGGSVDQLFTPGFEVAGLLAAVIAAAAWTAVRRE